MAGFKQLRVSLGCTGGPLGTRERAYANRNTVLIHHPVSSEVIKSNYRRPPHFNLPQMGTLPKQQVASLHTNLHPTTVILKQWRTQRARHPSEIWDRCVIMTQRVCVRNIYFIINHPLCLFDTCLCLLSTITTIDSPKKEMRWVIGCLIFTGHKVQVKQSRHRFVNLTRSLFLRRFFSLVLAANCCDVWRSASFCGTEQLLDDVFKNNTYFFLGALWWKSVKHTAL